MASTNKNEFIMINRRHLLLAAAVIIAAAPAAAAEMTELNFGIISTETTQNLKQRWEPLLADMQKAVGVKVNGFFAPDYAGVIEGMRFNKVHLAWYGNASGILAVDRANAEVFAQVIPNTGIVGYYSVLIVNKDSPIKSLRDLVGNPGKFTFSNGDPNSTSGFLIPSYYAWAQNNIDIRKHFTRVVSANHESNMLAVANKQVDVATFNTETWGHLAKSAPDKIAQVREIWRSPLIPPDPLAWRADLPADMKTKVKGFLTGYGKPGGAKSEAQLTHEKQVLTDLIWQGVNESSNKQLIPLREVGLFRDKLKIEADDKMSAEEKAAKLKEIDQKLTDLRRQAGA
jgi:phosphonate transport system substrate-binding protein